VLPGRRGACEVRENVDGTYFTLVWGNPCAVHIDPVEKKPLFHFHAGERILSLATAGCNIECRFCQNWNISQVKPEDTPNRRLPPDAVAAAAKAGNVRLIAFTYSEPVVFSEYVYDAALLAGEAGLKTVVVSNGFIEREPLDDLLDVLAAVKIDLKAFDDAFYREVCSARLAPVLATLERLAEKRVWFEIVYLVIPTLNDDMRKIREMSRWIVKNLGADAPLHFTAFHPAYKLRNLPRTAPSVLQNARDTARSEGLRFVYTGNVPGSQGESTFCPGCGRIIVERYGYFVMKKHLVDVQHEKKEAKCEYCGAAVPGVW